MTILENDSVIEELGFPKGSMTLVDNEKSKRIKENTARLVSNMTSGGSAANTIHGIACLGLETGFIGAIGNDETGRVFERDMKDVGVRTYLKKKDTDTGTAVAMISKDSERTFATHLGAAETLVAEDLNIAMFEGYDYLYLEGYLITDYELVEQACKYAKMAGLKVAIDMASFNVVEAFIDKFRRIVEEYIDLIFANEEEAKAFTGMENEDALEKLAELCEIAVVKIGSKGSLIRRGEEMYKVGAQKVESRDTTGAGDLYASGFFYGLLSGKNLEKCAMIGTLLAGTVIKVIGPKMRDDQWSDIKQKIKKI